MLKREQNHSDQMALSDLEDPKMFRLGCERFDWAVGRAPCRGMLP